MQCSRVRARSLWHPAAMHSVHAAPLRCRTLDGEYGHFDLVIKVYKAGEDPKHPEARCWLPCWACWAA